MDSVQVEVFFAKLMRCDMYKIKVLFFVTLIISMSFYTWFFWLIFHDRIKDKDFTNRHKCPACYGKSMCPFIENRSIILDGWSKYSPLDFVNVKNVHTGLLNGKKIILKKLGRPNELRKLDEDICKSSGEHKGCSVSQAIEKVAMVTAHELDVYLMKGLSDLMTCPSQRFIGLLREKFREDFKKKHGRLLSSIGKSHLFTTLSINPEPLIMQVFPASEGWPFPQYYGACGRLVIMENAGLPLNEFYNAPWEERVDYAYQVMTIMEHFTNNDLGYSLYFVDLSYDNLAVNEDGKVIVIDLENIIVVDKAKVKREMQPGWDMPYYSDFNECPADIATCVSFSKDDLCTRHVSDFNYYTACRNLLSQYASEDRRPGGFLHDLPNAIDTRLRPLLSECARPKKPDGRLTAKELLLKELRDIRNDYL